jgi:hypothetical protein
MYFVASGEVDIDLAGKVRRFPGRRARALPLEHALRWAGRHKTGTGVCAFVRAVRAQPQRANERRR